MKRNATETVDDVQETGAEEVVFSAEVRRSEGTYTLTVNDHVGGEVEVYTVPKKAVKRIPFYLSALRSKLL